MKNKDSRVAFQLNVGLAWLNDVIQLCSRQKTIYDNLGEQFQFTSTMIISSANDAFLARDRKWTVKGIHLEKELLKIKCVLI